ncbi:hypothetical protein ACFV2N_17145 [Streptomyces sp. NPDC059680]|uniref:hypothetical protein n=1 Tax=Streptomyces sp. NPDC059680 TaxID=3346904 RepID=UPI0036BB2492
MVPGPPPGTGRQRHQDVQALAQAGWSPSATGRRLGLDRKTVRSYRDSDLDTLLASARDCGAGLLNPYMPHIQIRFDAGCTVSLQLYREVCDLGGLHREPSCRQPPARPAP